LNVSSLEISCVKFSQISVVFADDNWVIEMSSLSLNPA
jgi:hypothetical protein